jgi:hypothetical protein
MFLRASASTGRARVIAPHARAPARSTRSIPRRQRAADRSRTRRAQGVRLRAAHKKSSKRMSESTHLLLLYRVAGDYVMPISHFFGFLLRRRARLEHNARDRAVAGKEARLSATRERVERSSTATLLRSFHSATMNSVGHEGPVSRSSEHGVSVLTSGFWSRWLVPHERPLGRDSTISVTHVPLFERCGRSSDGPVSTRRGETVARSVTAFLASWRLAARRRSTLDRGAELLGAPFHTHEPIARETLSRQLSMFALSSLEKAVRTCYEVC